MYSLFALGAMFSPILIGSFVDKDIRWNLYYIAPLSLSISLAVLGFFAFRGCKYRPLLCYDRSAHIPVFVVSLRSQTWNQPTNRTMFQQASAEMQPKEKSSMLEPS